MKKIIIGFGVLVVFGIYSLGIRHQNPLITKPSSISSNNGAGTSSASSGSGTTPASGSSSSSATTFKDGTYTGSVADAYYGNLQVEAIISGGKITDVKFLQYPNTHQTSVLINQQAMPYLKREALQSQSSNVQ